MSPDTERSFLDQRVADLKAAIESSRTEGHGLTVKRMEKTLARYEERNRVLLSRTRDEGGLNFETLGVDYLLIDEAHYYKNLGVTSNIQDVGGTASKRASDLDMKLSWLRSRHGERIATFATATPIANSVSEMWVMQHYLQPEALDAAGLDHFDAWAATFGKTITSLELAPDGSSYRLKDRFARFTNVPDLLVMYRQVADVRAGDTLGLKLPELTGGKPDTVIVPASDALAAFVADLAERADRLQGGRVGPDGDHIFKVLWDGRKAALDLRLVGLPSTVDGKISAAADRIAQIHDRSQNNSYLGLDGRPADRPGALQLVFCDLATPGGEGWNAYDELRDQLVARGLPAEGIRFVHDAKNDVEKERLFAACRAGSVSVLVGSTPKMGVGTNVQTRAVALHHLDCPWKPAELEQRDGRILRQGNQNPEVEIIRYATEGSFDVYSWQTVERKAKFLAQITVGDITDRSVEDVGDQALSCGEVKALASGNPLVMEKAGVESEIAKLARLESSWRTDQAALPARIERAERLLERCTAEAAALHTASSRLPDLSGDRFRIVVHDTTYTARKPAGEALQQTLSDHYRHLRLGQHEDLTLGSYGGFPVTASFDRDALGTSIQLRLDGIPRRVSRLVGRDLATTEPLGLISRIERLPNDLELHAEQAEQEADQARKDLARAAQRLGQPFEHKQRLTTLRDKLEEINAQLIPEPDPEESVSEAPEPPQPVNSGPLSAPHRRMPETIARQAAMARPRPGLAR